MRQMLIVTLLLLCVSSATGQTPSEFEKRYGKPVISYQVSENILMTPEYTDDGQVCLMRLSPRHFGPNANYVSPNLPFPELKTVLNQLVPLQVRGIKKEPFDSGATGGGVEWMTYTYENVKFSFVASFRPDPDSWKTRKEYVFSVEAKPSPRQPKPKDLVPSENDFSSGRHLRTQTVTITWIGRKCANQ